MFIVLAEDDNDFRTFKVLIRRLLGDRGIPINGRGYEGCGDMLNKGARYLRSLNPSPDHRCIVVHDCDEAEARDTHNKVVRRIFEPAQIKAQCCVVIPKEEIEAWILADVECISAVIPKWKPTVDFPSPETLKDPKGILHKLSRDAKSRPRITEANTPALADALRLEIVERKCPSFRSLVDVVRHRRGNVEFGA